MDPSFFFAIFKRLQAATGGMLTTGGEHFDSDGSMDLAGGFSLRSGGSLGAFTVYCGA